MLVAVTGATGFVGNHLVRALLDQGHSVRTLVRCQDKAARVLPDHPQIEHTTGDIADQDAVQQLVDGADACCHLVGIIREAAGGQTFRKIHETATRTVVSACETAGTRRYLHMSALGASPHGPAEYQKTKFEAERFVRASGLDWTIYRPGLIHGPDGEFLQAMRGWCEGRAAPYLFMPYFCRIEQRGAPTPLNPPKIVAPVVAPIHVDDVAQAFSLGLERGDATGEVIPLSGPELITWPDMLRLVRDTLPLGKPELKPLGIPGRIAAIKARVAKMIGLAGALPFDEGMALMGQNDSYCPLDKARSLLGLDPRPFESSFKTYAA